MSLLFYYSFFFFLTLSLTFLFCPVHLALLFPHFSRVALFSFVSLRFVSIVSKQSHDNRIPIITHADFIFVSVVDKISGLSFVTEQNKTTMVFTGSNQTFTWQLSLTDQEKSKQLTVQFGRWDKELDNVKGGYLMTFIQEPSDNGSVGTWNLKRLQWLGDLTRDYFVAFKLFNVKLSDAGDYGIRFRVDGFPIKTKQSWFTLSVEVKMHYSS